MKRQPEATGTQCETRKQKNIFIPKTLTSLLNLLHHFCHHVLVVRLSSLNDLDVQAVVNLLKL